MMDRIKRRYARLGRLDRIFLAGYGLILTAGIAACLAAAVRSPVLAIPAGIAGALLVVHAATLWTLSRFSFWVAAVLLAAGLAASGGLLGGIGLLAGFLGVAGLRAEQPDLWIPAAFLICDAACLGVFVARRKIFGDPPPGEPEEEGWQWKLPDA